jgi:hypothetical protein
MRCVMAKRMVERKEERRDDAAGSLQFGGPLPCERAEGSSKHQARKLQRNNKRQAPMRTLRLLVTALYALSRLFTLRRGPDELSRLAGRAVAEIFLRPKAGCRNHGCRTQQWSVKRTKKRSVRICSDMLAYLMGGVGGKESQSRLAPSCYGEGDIRLFAAERHSNA